MLKLVRSHDPILHQVAAEVTDFTGIAQLVTCMFETMLHHDGIGLAAPQIGISKRVIVVQTHGFRQAFVNPVITRRCNGQHTATEGCLSFPGENVIKVRDKTVLVEALDVTGHPFRLKLNGLQARVVQHEIDHLDGVTIA